MYLEQKSVRKTFPVSVFGVELKKKELVAFKVSKTTFCFKISSLEKLKNKMMGGV